MVYNPYLDPAMQKRQQEALERTLAPGMRQGIDTITSQISPYERGRRGASLMRQVYQPAQQARAGLAMQQAQAGTQFAAEAPFRSAPLTGMFGGQQTQQAQQQQFGQGLANRQLGLQQTQLADALRTAQLQRDWYPSQHTGYGPGGQMTTQFLGQMLPWMTQGYVAPKQGMLPGGFDYKTERDISPEWETAERLGFQNPYEQALLTQADPDAMKNILTGQIDIEPSLPSGFSNQEQSDLYVQDRGRFAEQYPALAKQMVQERAIREGKSFEQLGVWENDFAKWFKFYM